VNVFDEILDTEGKMQLIDPQNKTAAIPPAPLDPRADLTADHPLWLRILTNAQHLAGDLKIIVEREQATTSLYHILHGLRCGGARIEETLHGYKLHPGNEDFAAPETWEATKRRWLDPVRADIGKLFKMSKLGEVVEEELPPGAFEPGTAVAVGRVGQAAAGQAGQGGTGNLFGGGG
jgi:hypothetical protein